MSNGKKTLDFEINLLPVISILAVCIAFLLLTAVWVQIGKMEVTQAYGTSGKNNGQQITLYITLKGNNLYRMTVKTETGQALLDSQIKTAAKSEEFAQNINSIKKKFPEMQTALLQPFAETSYDEMIQVMDAVRGQEIKDIGVAPL